MRFSAKEEYALRALVELAANHGRGPVPLSRVAAVQQISLAYLEQIVAPLREAGLLESWRGAYGGYSLARTPAQITVGDILRVVEGAIVPMPCVSSEGSCAREAGCATRQVWERVRSSLVETLDSITLADLIEQAGAPA
jgi:Rrf2 family cysteine metabolism transcriptional repressor